MVPRNAIFLKCIHVAPLSPWFYSLMGVKSHWMTSPGWLPPLLSDLAWSFTP